MNLYFLRSWLLLLLIFIGRPASVIAVDDISQKPYNECIFVISNYSGVDANIPESRSIQELLNLEVDGFRFNLDWGKNDNVLNVKSATGKLLDFAGVLSEIKSYLDKNPRKVLTLFLDFNVNVNELTSVFETAGLLNYLYRHDNMNGWSSIKNMTDHGKRLVIFSMQEHRANPDWLHYVWNYAVEPYFSLLEAPDFIGEFLKGDPKNDLLIYNEYNFPNKYQNSNNISFDADQNPYLIEHIKSIWSRTGKTPNFIMLDTYQGWVRAVLSRLNNFITLNGTVTYNAQILNYVNWEGRNSLTSGRFCFPAGPGDNLTLTPRSPGYRFKPASITFEEPSQNKVQHFIAYPLELNENLEAHYPLDHNAFDKTSNSFDGTCVGVKFVKDSLRGGVALFDGKSHIVLPKAEEFRIRDHDFTVAAWIKIEKYLENKQDYCIIGTPNNSYQEGIHLLIRNARPYFGFYSNDLAGRTIIEPNRWYHMVWRYNKLNGEQAIFIDGKLDSRSLGHPSYKGRDKLFIGVAGFSWASNMLGEIGPLTIWSRALGNEEIWGLSKEISEIVPEKNYLFRHPIVFGIIALVFIGAVIILLVLFIRKKTGKKGTFSLVDISVSRFIPVTSNQEKNYIQLFGDFKVVNKLGEDITYQFTPKIKQLFLLVLLFSERDKKGISTKELSEILWPNYSAQNTKNSRGVTMRKLRLILESMDQVEIIFNVENWYLKVSGDLYCDYLECQKLLNYSGDDPRFFSNFFHIVQKGELFKDESHDWLDDFKGFIDNSIVDNLVKYIQQLNPEKDIDLILKLSDRILLSDPVNDQALAIKLKQLLKQNNYKLARYTYDKFVSTYAEMYGEKYKSSFESIVHE